jgi:hypothetical protein
VLHFSQRPALLPLFGGRKCLSKKPIEHVVQSVQQWWMAKIDHRRSMNEINPSKKVLRPFPMPINRRACEEKKENKPRERNTKI